MAGDHRAALLKLTLTDIDARGYVHLDDYEAYDLSDPYTVALNRTHDGPGYMLSAFHQLHCLVSQKHAERYTPIPY